MENGGRSNRTVWRGRGDVVGRDADLARPLRRQSSHVGWWCGMCSCLSGGALSLDPMPSMWCPMDVGGNSTTTRWSLEEVAQRSDRMSDLWG